MIIIKGYGDASIRTLARPDAIKHVGGREALSIIGGEFAITRDEDNLPIVTILGSCVAVMLYDKVTKIKGMNHFLLPGKWDKGNSYRYGIHAIEVMMNEMYRLGCKKQNLVAKIAGGANLFQNFQENIGQRNVEFARLFCKEEKIPLLSEHVLGNHGRMVMLECGFETRAKSFENRFKDQEIIKEEKAIEEKLVREVSKAQIEEMWIWEI